MRSLISFVLFVPFAAACGSASEAAVPPPTPSAQATPAAAGDDQALCVEVFTRNRACTETYVPALVDARAKYDQPPGIAAEVKADRNGVIAQAKAEWANDSTDEAIGHTCQQIAAQLGEADRADGAKAKGCLAETECGAYTACVMPLFEKRFHK